MILRLTKTQHFVVSVSLLVLFLIATDSLDWAAKAAAITIDSIQRFCPIPSQVCDAKQDGKDKFVAWVNKTDQLHPYFSNDTILVKKSTDNGTTFLPAVKIFSEAAGPPLDVVDWHIGVTGLGISVIKDRVSVLWTFSDAHMVYCTWTDTNYIADSSNRGLTFGEPFKVRYCYEEGSTPTRVLYMN